MRVFQIKDGFCFYDMTNTFPTLASTVGRFAPDIQIVEAPDNVREGWGYLDGEFIPPTPPEGWLYDKVSGMFYPEDETPPSKKLSADESITNMEYALALTDETAIALYEAMMAQEEINTVQDDALIELYEMIGG